MGKTAGIMISSALMVLPFCLFTFVFARVEMLVPITAQLLMVIPLVAASESGFRLGLLSGMVFSVSWLLLNVLLLMGSISLPSVVFLVLFIPVSTLSTGLASIRLDNKRTFVFPLILAVIVQIFIYVTF